MYSCDQCNYKTDDRSNFRRHQKSTRHKNKLKCECGQQFTHSSSYSRHRKSRCPRYELEGDEDYSQHDLTPDFDVNPNPRDDDHYSLIRDLTHKLELEKLKHQYEMEKCRNEADKLVSLKEFEKKDLQIEYMAQQLEQAREAPTQRTGGVTNQQIKNQINVTGGNNQFISKAETLNMYFKNVIDIDTFTENLKNGYGLTSEDTKSILDGYKMSGIKSYVPNVCYYLKKSYTKQYKAIYGRDPEPEEILLPFVISDSGLRQHYEKTIEDWQSTTSNENIKKIIVISNDQIYQHHNQMIPMSALDKVIILNGMLRINNYNTIVSDAKEKKMIHDHDLEDGLKAIEGITHDFICN